MEYRSLGSTELRVSALGFGCSHLGRSAFDDHRSQTRELLEAAFDGGINFFDTAPTYAYGDSERYLGRVFADRRDQVILATKGGYRYSSYARYAQYLLPFIGPFRRLLVQQRAQLKKRTRKRQDFSVRYLRTMLEGSLRRLRTDYIDLYQLHGPPPEAIESDDVLRFLEDTVREGKVRFCGVSVGTCAEARLCLKYSIFSTLQISFNVIEQEPAAEVFPYAKLQNAGLLVKMPLYRGLLTDQHRVVVGPAPEQIDPTLWAQRRGALEFMLSEQHPTIAIAAMRFIFDHPEVAVVLTGTSSPDHLRSSLAAAAAGPLSERVMTQARELCGIDWNFVARSDPAEAK